MIVSCDNCNKKFEVDDNLIPSEGRMLQCGNCNNQWFFKLERKHNENFKKLIKDEKDKFEVDKKTYEKKDFKKNLIEEDKILNKNKKNKLNYFNYFLVVIISFVALILTMETFKEPLSSIFPNIEILLNNLYQSIEDIKLFILDLLK